jgi:hypothetical protein
MRYTNFSDGEQPCQNLLPKIDGNGFAQWENVHICPECGLRRQFCTNCNKDHHIYGWEVCATVETGNFCSKCGQEVGETFGGDCESDDYSPCCHELIGSRRRPLSKYHVFDLHT